MWVSCVVEGVLMRMGRRKDKVELYICLRSGGHVALEHLSLRHGVSTIETVITCVDILKHREAMGTIAGDREAVLTGWACRGQRG